MEESIGVNQVLSLGRANDEVDFIRKIFLRS